MKEAALEIRSNKTDTEISQCGVSVDGTWQRRGYSSLNECVPVISIDSGKVLDVEFISKVCRLCNSKNKELNTIHNCAKHIRSSSAMEHLGVYRIFELSVEMRKLYCQVIYSQFGLAIHQTDHQARRRFVEWAQNEIAVVPDFHKRILFSDEARFWLNGYVNKQNCRIWWAANPQVYVETPLHPEKLTVWCALWAGGILLQKR
ncbi:uncharacterized protein TNCV_3822951 [Trichonephila clavipes]|nr:uncharacterized protein TNCV_3822951 [Trichonephila clavipes]